MEINTDNAQQEKLRRAKKRVDDIKGFYIHFSIYLIINTFILINSYMNTDDFWRWSHFFTLFFWGIGVLFHAARVFGIRLLFTKSWEDRQIQKYIDRDRDDANKYL